ncbi:MAG: hypothetical protein IPK15_13145 [Verrucomicrobia bacterium]|nr:hypothetical protein [Verrucomicrobiota bacterium]
METTKSFETPEEAKLHFLDYWRIVRVRKAVVLAVFLLVTITTTLVTFILPPTFASTARISVQRDTTDVQGVNLGQGSGQSYSVYDFAFWIQTEFEKIQSKMILYPVITNLDLHIKWGEKYKEGALRMDTTFAMLKRKIDVTQSPRTSLIEIKAFSDDPNEAAAIANRIADVYRESRTNLWLEMSSRGLEALNAELASQTAVITNLQKEVYDMKELYGISDVDIQQGMSVATVEAGILQTLDRLRIETLKEYEKQNTTYNQLTNYTRVELKRSMLTVVSDNLLMSLLQQLSVEEGKLAQITNSLSLDHPDVKGIRGSIGVLNDQIDGKLDGMMRGLEANVNAKRAELNAVTLERERALTNDISKAVARSPYNQKSGNWKAVVARDKLKSRIIEEKVRQRSRKLRLCR